MKLTLLIVAILCFASTMGYERLWAKGDVLLSELQNGNDELHIVLFYDSTNTEDAYGKVRENQEVTNNVVEYLKSISDGGATPVKVPVYYATVDAADPYNQNLIYKSGVDASDLDNGPVLLAIRQGKGFRQHGPKVVAALRDSVTKLTAAAK